MEFISSMDARFLTFFSYSLIFLRTFFPKFKFQLNWAFYILAIFPALIFYITLYQTASFQKWGRFYFLLKQDLTPNYLNYLPIHILIATIIKNMPKILFSVISGIGWAKIAPRSPPKKKPAAINSPIFKSACPL